MPEPLVAPPRAVPASDSEYFAVLTKAVFQSGISWKVINSKWPGFQEAFDQFDIAKVASYGPEDEDRLVADQRIVRNSRKISATVKNARTLEDLIDEHGSVAAWLDTTRDLPWPERKAAVAEPFAHFGTMGAYFFLWSVGEATPPHEEESTWAGPAPAEAALR
jgi:3-methyladenine DNA glycosylase Tag